jgi:hypothetical protein
MESLKSTSLSALLFQCFVINEAKEKESRLAQALQQAQQLEKQIR